MSQAQDPQEPKPNKTPLILGLIFVVLMVVLIGGMWAIDYYNAPENQQAAHSADDN